MQAVQQHHIDRVTVVPESIVLDRRTDDTLMLISRAGMLSAPRAIKAFKCVCKTAGQPLHDSKEQRMQTVFIFDGLAYDLPAKAIGYPRSKQAKLLPVLAKALNISRTRALNDVPAQARDKMAIAFDSVGFATGKLSRLEYSTRYGFRYATCSNTSRTSTSTQTLVVNSGSEVMAPVSPLRTLCARTGTSISPTTRPTCQQRSLN